MPLIKKYIKIWLVFCIIMLVIFCVWFDLIRFFVPNQHIKYSKSDYVKSHQNDLVLWREWHAKTIQEAKQKNKPMFITIGFSTCYWCHHLQQTVFKNPFSAKMINRYFIPVIVDRHQYPQIDDYYKDLMIYQVGKSGWPMVIVTTPDGIPLYFTNNTKREALMSALRPLQIDWKKNAKETTKKAKKWAEEYAKNQIVHSDQMVGDLKSYFDVFNQNDLDLTYGGLNESVKFPFFRQLRVFLEWDLIPVSFVEQTVSSMMTSPMFDFVDGGVHRYSAVYDWKRPHFEKLLIDQVYFIDLLLALYQKTQRPWYLDAVRLTTLFMVNQLQDSTGLFFTGLDAGELGGEGQYYFFSEFDLDRLSPLNYARMTTVQGSALVYLFNPQDIIGVDRSALVNIRQYSSYYPKKDTFISIRDNIILFQVLHRYQSLLKDPLYDQIRHQLKQALIAVPTETSLVDMLYQYDFFQTVFQYQKAHQLSPHILAKVAKAYPYVDPILDINHDIQAPNFLDSYYYQQPVAFLLKYYHQLKWTDSKTNVCTQVKEHLFLPWYQASLVDSIYRYCD